MGKSKDYSDITIAELTANNNKVEHEVLMTKKKQKGNPMNDKFSTTKERKDMGKLKYSSNSTIAGLIANNTEIENEFFKKKKKQKGNGKYGSFIKSFNKAPIKGGNAPRRRAYK